MLKTGSAPMRSVGFSLLEVIAAITIMAIVAAVVVPMTTGSIDRQGIADTKAILDTIRLTDVKFLTATVNHMSYLHHIAEPPRVGELSTCDGTNFGGGAVFKYASTDSTGWAGPYGLKVVSSTGGWPTPAGVLDDRIIRNYAANGSISNSVQQGPVSGGSSTAALYVTMRNVRLEDAQALNALFDPANEASNPDLSNSRGFIRWLTPDGSLNVVMTYSWSSTNIVC